jgi:hypothetical protein
LKRTAIILAAMACLAAAENDHAILERGFAPGRVAELESDLYNGKAALYRPVRVPLRIAGAKGEHCETRLSTATGVITLDWTQVHGLELGRFGDRFDLYVKGGLKADKLIVQFPSREAATPVLLAMERLQTACRPRVPGPPQP